MIDQNLSESEKEDLKCSIKKIAILNQELQNEIDYIIKNDNFNEKKLLKLLKDNYDQSYKIDMKLRKIVNEKILISLNKIGIPLFLSITKKEPHDLNKIIINFHNELSKYFHETIDNILLNLSKETVEGNFTIN